MTDEIKELQDLVEHHKTMKTHWMRRANFFYSILMTETDFSEDEIDRRWNQFVLENSTIFCSIQKNFFNGKLQKLAIF